MTDTPRLSDAKRALLERYLRGDIPPAMIGAHQQRRVRTPPLSSPPLSTIDTRVSLHSIQTDGVKPPFFYIHVHWIGAAFYTFSLARDLGSDQPMYVLDPYRFDGLPAPPMIEDMAATYVTRIRAVQPEGPYFLGGFCAGGLLAYEVAQQLHAAGQDIGLLALIDPMAGPVRSIRLTARFIQRVGALLRLSPSTQLAWFLRLRYASRIVRRKADENTPHVDRLIHEWRAAHPSRSAPLPPAEALRQDWMAVFIWSVARYIPLPYAGQITYFFAAENPDHRRLWWGDATTSDKATIYLIPGTHTTCRTEYLHAMATCLSGCLREAQGV